MTKLSTSRRASFLSRRSFLRGAAGVGFGLPFLEGMPERSAWANGAAPVFSLFVCTVEGVLPSQFFPSETGLLTTRGLADAGKATSELAPFAKQLLFLKGVNWSPQSGPSSDGHIQGLCMALTATPTMGAGTQIMASGPSADVVIGQKVQPAGTEPLVLYAGNKKNGWVAERLSFSGPGQVLPAIDNPYTFYRQLTGLLAPDGTTPPGADAIARRLAASRNSIHDVVREELRALMGNTRLSRSDRMRLEQHLDGIRDVEVDMGNLGLDRCATATLDVQKLKTFEEFEFDRHGMVEDMAQLHMSLVALAFACNYRRTATLQWGEPSDKTVYDVPSNETLGWPFSFICHRTQSDSATGMNPLAEQAHGEIDVVRMKSFAIGLEQFEARGLADHGFVLWTNAFRDCPAHQFRDVPHILWGNAGGYLKQGEYVDCGGVGNNRLLNTLITAAIQDTGEVVTDFGSGTPGLLDAIRA